MNIIVFFVPLDALERVKKSMFEAGAGKVGSYDQCSWEVAGSGQFRPLQGSNPSIGTIGKLEQLVEYRVEMPCLEVSTRKAIQALRESHPYEEPAFHVIKVEI